MSEIILKDHSNQLENLSSDLNKLLELREQYYDSAEKLIAKKASEEKPLITSIERQMQTLVQRTKNWPKSVVMRSVYGGPSVAVTTIVHCKTCLAKVSVSRSTQTLPSFVQMIRRSNSYDSMKTLPRSSSLNSLKTPPASPKVPKRIKTPPVSPKPTRGIIKKTIIDNKSKLDSMKNKSAPRILIKSKEVKTKKEPVIEWSAMEWNGKNEIEELHQKIKILNDRIETVAKNGGDKNDTDPHILNSEWNKIQPRITTALEKRLDMLEKDIKYLDSSM